MKNIFMAATILAMTLAPLGAKAEEATMTRSITMSGHGEVMMVPDQATINLGVLTTAATVREALDQNNKAMQALHSLLKEAGVGDKDIQTSNFSINPQYDQSRRDGKPNVMKFDVTNTVTVLVRKLDSLGDLLDKAVSSGANQLYGIAFQVAKPDTALDEARKLAVTEATRKAKLYSEAAGITLGPITLITEGTEMPSPRPFRAHMAADAMAVPIAAGEQSIGVDVNITWELK